MTNEFIKTIFARRSIRKYKSQAVAKGNIKKMLEAAMSAPSASNRKPWHFVTVENRRTLDSLGRVHPHGKMLFDAPFCIAVCGDPKISVRYWVQDCSAATENLLLAATALGLGAVWLGVYPREERIAGVRRILKIPENVIPLNIVSIGHPSEEKEPRTQYDETRVHREHW